MGSKVETRIENICRMSGFTTQAVIKKTKKILDAYRDMKSDNGLIKEDVVNRLREAALLKRKNYKDRKGHSGGSLDYLLKDIICTDWSKTAIGYALVRMEWCDFDTEDYRYIIKEAFLADRVKKDNIIMHELNLARQTYYRRKREGILLFGILLWHVILEKIQQKQKSAR